VWVSVAWLLVLATIIASLIPVPPPPDISFGDKLAHIAVYSMLAVWFAGIYRRSRYPVIALGLILLGGGLELLQSTTAYRMGDWSDFLANGMGVLLGLVICRLGLGGWCAWIESRF
jgi:VanZ family protein